MSAGSRLLLLGLRGSGKTTYLAALWHLVEASELPTMLTAPELQPDRQYLNRIRDSWLRFEPVERTSLRSQEIISLVLRDGITGGAIDLSIPDVSGELFRLQWATRQASRFYADLATNAAGLLLFVHAQNVRQSVRIMPRDAAKPPVDVGDTTGGSPTIEWTPDLTPTQVQLVEMLQFALSLRRDTTPLRVAAIISAWDLVSEPILPSAWLESQLPLLSQFLTANQTQFRSRIYGVSAQGGDFAKDMARLQAESIPSKRIRVFSETLEPSSDLTSPLRFLLDRA